MFERKHEKLASRSLFARRMALSVLMAGALILVASMILGGMGPINTLPTADAKLFASAYALFSGLVLISIMGIMLAPVTHRMLHKFHIDEADL